MLRNLLASTAVLLSLPAMAGDQAPVPREGSSSYVTLGSGTMKVLPMGKERSQVSWEFLGVQVSEDGKGITHNASVRCVGVSHVVNDGMEGYLNACTLTRPDGDQIFVTEKLVSGKRGAASSGTSTIVGGTGKLAGIQGGSEWTRFFVRPAADGTFQTVTRSKASYKLP
jgi:hypothetical protein